MDKEFSEVFQEEIVNEGKIEELGKQITGLADKFKEGKDDVMTMADEMITNGKMPDPELIKMLETGESQMIVHLIAKKMGVQWTKDNGYGEMRFKQNYPEAVFVKHKMYDPKTGKSVDVNTQDDHEKYKKMGYTHKEEVESQVKKLADRFRSMARKEEVEIDEKKSATGYELYHKDFSSAMQHAYAFAKSKGHVVDPKEIDDKVATGPKKPSSGKTNRYSLKAGRKTVEIQVANLDNKRYELNMYIEEVEIGKGLKKFKETLKDLTTEKVKRLEKEGAAEFMAAASAAKKAGKKKFTFGGKEHPVTIKTHIPLAKEEVDLYIQHVSGFDSFITEGRPALDPNYIHPANGVPDTERRRLVQSQQKRYKLSDIESIARKHKVKLELSKYSANQPIQFDDEWTLYTNKGIGLIYDYRSNDTTISGWKIDKNKLRQYKDKYESQDATMNSLHVRKGRVTVSGFESAFELIGESLKEDAPVNATGVNVVGTGDDPTVWKKKKKKTIKTEEFGGKKVFVVSPQKYWDSRLGKSRYSRYEKYVGNDAIGEAIREYGLSNPKAPIILKNSKTGAMLYLKYGKPNVE